MINERGMRTTGTFIGVSRSQRRGAAGIRVTGQMADFQPIRLVRFDWPPCIRQWALGAGILVRPSADRERHVGVSAGPVVAPEARRCTVRCAFDPASRDFPVIRSVCRGGRGESINDCPG